MDELFKLSGKLKNRSPLIYFIFGLRDNSTSSSINGFLWSNFPNFGFALQTQFLIYIFFYCIKIFNFYFFFTD